MQFVNWTIILWRSNNDTLHLMVALTFYFSHPWHNKNSILLNYVCVKIRACNWLNKSHFRIFYFADYTVLDARKVHGNLRNMLISTDQSQRVSQPVSQITLSQFRVSHSQITRSPWPSVQRALQNEQSVNICNFYLKVANTKWNNSP